MPSSIAEAEVAQNESAKEETPPPAHGQPPARRKTKDQRETQAIEQMLAIQGQGAQEAGQLGFIARLLIQATMPHSKAKGNEWSRTNGKLTVHMMAPSAVGLPYGSYARLLLVWISTQAVRNKARLEKGYVSEMDARRLELGNSLNAFMSDLGLLPTGGKEGSISRLREQMNRLFKTTVSATYAEYIEEAGSIAERVSAARVADESCLWWNSEKLAQGTLWGSWVELSPHFFTLITQSPVPLDMRVLRFIKRSPMALDVYCWATYRVSYLRKPITIPWPSLMAQIGAGYSDTAQGRRDFKKRFLDGLHKVQLAWPELKATMTDKGLQLMPCAPQVSPRAGQLKRDS